MNHLLQSLIANLCIVSVVSVLALLAPSSASDASSETVAAYDHVNQNEDDAHSGSNESSEHDDDHAHGVHVVHLQFSYVERPLILTLFLLAVVLIKIGQSRCGISHIILSKIGTIFSTSQLFQILTDFQNYFTVRIRRKFVVIPVLSLKIPPHLRCVATLPCEMSVS